MAGRRDEKGGEEGGLKTAPKSKVQKPPMYKVMFHNDDYTPMEFVVAVLQDVFKHSLAAATRIMLQVHQSGVGLAGVYTKDIAETRVDRAMTMARKSGHPLQLSMEPE
jgi:ATP-dependent Clp protease adaptor protein ClpS